MNVIVKQQVLSWLESLVKIVEMSATDAIQVSVPKTGRIEVLNSDFTVSFFDFNQMLRSEIGYTLDEVMKAGLSFANSFK